MDIILVVLRNIIVENNIHVVHVYTSRSYVRRDKYFYGAVSEFLHYFVPLGLLKVSVESLSEIAPSLKLFHDLVDTFFRIAENNGQFRRIHIYYTAEGVRLGLFLHVKIRLLNAWNGEFLPCDLYIFGLVHIPSGKVKDLLAHGGGEHYRLSFIGDFEHYCLNIVPEPHIKHFIGLIKHNVFYGAHLESMPSHMIHYSSGSAYNYLNSLFKRGNLPVYGLASVYGKDLYVFHVLKKFSELLAHLDGKLPCGA